MCIVLDCDYISHNLFGLFTYSDGKEDHEENIEHKICLLVDGLCPGNTRFFLSTQTEKDNYVQCRSQIDTMYIDDGYCCTA